MRKFLFFFLLTAFASNAQINDFAEAFIFFPKNVSTCLPAYAGADADVQGSIMYRSYFGQLAAIRTYMADFNYNVQKKKKSFPNFNKHIVGAGFYSDREGDFINRNRLVIRYVWHTRLTESLSLSGGGTLNTINYVFKASSAGASGSDFAWSDNLSTSLYSSTFKIGISVNDINQPSLTPLDVPSIVYRFYTIHSEKKIDLTFNSRLLVSGRANYIPQGYSTFVAHVGILLREQIGFHGFAHSHQGWGVALDFPSIEASAGVFDISMAYRIPYSFGFRIPYNVFEINLGYRLNRNDD